MRLVYLLLMKMKKKKLEKIGQGRRELGRSHQELTIQREKNKEKIKKK